MTRREELAHDYLRSLLAADNGESDGPHADVAMAFALADAFLAACEPEQKPKQKPEREPDAVLILEDDYVFRTADGSRWSPMCDRLLAGRERVRLRVFVEEEEA